MSKEYQASSYVQVEHRPYDVALLVVIGDENRRTFPLCTAYRFCHNHASSYLSIQPFNPCIAFYFTITLKVYADAFCIHTPHAVTKVGIVILCVTMTCTVMLVLVFLLIILFNKYLFIEYPFKFNLYV